jgi:membrane protease subunit HflK
MKVDEALTTGKLEIQFALTREIQKNLDMLETGITIKSCNLQEVHPPEDVVDAFNDVSRAQSDREKIKSQADAYRNELLPKARGRAQEILNEATAYRSRTVNKAKGESGKFNALLVEYRKSPSVTHRRLFLETLEKVLPKVTKIIIRDKPGQKGRAVIIK